MQEMKDVLDAVTPTQRWARTGMRIGLIGGTAATVLAILAVIIGMWVAGVSGWIIAIVAAISILFCVAIYGVIYYFLRMVGKPQADAKRLREYGEPAEAVILRVEDTGVTVNNIYPQIKLYLEVRPKGRPPYQAETKMLINRLDIPTFQPGVVLPVMIDPRSPNRVAVGGPVGEISPAAAAGPGIAGITGMMPGAAGPVGAGMTAGGAEAMLTQINASNVALLARGTPAQAKILAAQPLGVLVNGNNPAMKFQLEVYPSDRPTFQAEAIGVIAEASVPKYQPDKVVFVKFDPNDTTQVTLDHS